MKDRNNVFDYQYIPSRIHNLNAIYKILSIILIIISLVVADSIISILVINLYIFIFMLWSNISIRLYIDNLNIFRSIVLVVFIFVSVLCLNIFTGLLWSIKVIDIIVYLAVIMITTSLNDVVNSVYKLLKPIKNIINVSELSLNIGLCFKFFNIFYSEYNRIKISKKIRGVRFSDMTFFDRVDFIFNEMRPAYISSIRRLKLLKKNMYVRNYSISDTVSNYRLNKWRKTDTILLIINFIVIIITFIY